MGLQNSGLVPQRFTTAMQKVAENYVGLDVTTSTSDLETAFTNLRAHWHSPLGYAKTNELAGKVSTLLNGARKTINRQYLTMLSSANQYMMSQGGQPFQLDRLSEKEVVTDVINFDDPEGPHIDDADLEEVKEQLKNGFDKLRLYLNNIVPYVESDEQFGYRADGDVNPRVVIQTTVKNVVEKLDETLQAFMSTFNSDVDQDRENVSKSLNNSTVTG